jgi:L-ascorbate metabolism protein UlaG (beta-lactamase superfamily)
VPLFVHSGNCREFLQILTEEVALSKTWKVMLLMILAVVLFSFLVFGVRTAFRPSAFSLFEASAPGGAARAGFPDDPPSGGAVVWYLGHCGYAVRTQSHLLVFDYQEQRDGQQPKSRPAQPSLAAGWIDPGEIKDLKVRVFVSHSHGDHYDPVIFTWKEAVPDIIYYFGWKASDDPSYNCLVGPRAELKHAGLDIATINSHHSGVPEVAWLVKVDGLVTYHNGDCQPGDPSSEHDFLKTKTDGIDLAFVFPVYEDGQKYTAQNLDFFTKFRVRAAFPMHVQAGDAMYLNFQKTFQAKFPALTIHVPMKMGQKFIFADGKIVN